jgi:MFS family permease
MDAARMLLRANVKNNLLNGIAWAIGFNFVMPFIPVLAGKLGATNTHFAMLSSIPALLSIVVTLPASIVLDRFRRQKPIIAGMILLSRFCYLLMAFVPLLKLSPITALIALVGVYTATNSVIAVAYQSMMGEIIPVSYRNRVFAQRNVWTGFTGMAVALVAGWGIDQFSYPYGYQAAFLLGFAASLAETWYFNKLRIPSEEAPEPDSGADAAVPERDAAAQAAQAAIRRPRWLERFAMGGGRPFYLLCASAIVFIFTWQAAWPVFNKIKVVTLAASNTWMSIDAVVGAIGTMISFPLCAKLADRKGNGIVLFLSSLLLAIGPFNWIYAPSMQWVCVYDFIGGIGTGGFNQAIFNRLLELVPPTTRQRAIALYTTLSQVSAIFAPIVGMQLYGHLPYAGCMAVLGAARIIGSLCFLFILLPLPAHSSAGRSSMSG